MDANRNWRPVATVVAAVAAWVLMAGQPAAAQAGPSTGYPGAGLSATRHVDAGVLTHLNGVCEAGEFCMYYGFGFAGSLADFEYADGDLSDNVFVGPGAGQGQPVSTETGSVLNRDLNLGARLCTGVGSTGICGTVPPNSGGNLSSVYRVGLRSFTWV